MAVVPYIVVSGVIEHPIDVVWEAVQIHNFDHWYRPVARSYRIPDTDPDMEMVRWEFNSIFDKNSCDFEVMSKDKINYMLAYYVTSVKSPVKYDASASAIKLFPITTGKNKGHTFMQYTGEYASDVNPDMLKSGIEVRTDALECLGDYLNRLRGPGGQKALSWWVPAGSYQTGRWCRER